MYGEVNKRWKELPLSQNTFSVKFLQGKKYLKNYKS